MPFPATLIFRKRADSRVLALAPGRLTRALCSLAVATFIGAAAAEPGPVGDAAGLTGFPQSWALETVQRSERGSADESAPRLVLLLPGRSRAVHLRATAMVVARLGQLGFFAHSHCLLEPIEAWKTAALHRPAILIARRDQLGGVELPSPVAAVLESLVPGQGLLAEYSPGAPASPHRVLLLSGADDDGLEKAALTVASTPALSACSSNPAVINLAPDLPPELVPAAEPVAIDSPVDVHRVLLADPLARGAAYVVPAGPALKEVRTLLPLWIRLGRELPSAPVLWPEVVTYQHGSPPDAARLQGRAALILGSVAEWPDALPAGHRGILAVVMASPSAERVNIQGHTHPVAAFDPTLVFAQMVASPWTPERVAVLAGGWQGYAGPALARMLSEPGSPGELRGDLVAMDALGRGAAGGARAQGSESFAAAIQRRIAPGQTAEQSVRSEALFQSWRKKVRGENAILLGFCALGLSALVAVRLVLMWERQRVGRRSRQAEGPAGGPG